MVARPRYGSRMIESLIEQYGYVAIVVGAFLEGETIVVLGGFAAHRHLLTLPGVMISAFAGAIASDQLFFFLGRRHGDRLLARFPRWKPGVSRVRRLLNRYHMVLIVLFRFLYGLRNITPFALGMSDVPTARFVTLNMCGAAVWAVSVTLVGWSVGEAAHQFLGHLQQYERTVGGAIIAVGLALWLWHQIANRRRGAAEEGNAPVES